MIDRRTARSEEGGIRHLPYPGSQSNGGNSPHRYRLPLRFRTGPRCGSKNGTAPLTFSIIHHIGCASSITRFAASISIDLPLFYQVLNLSTEEHQGGQAPRSPPGVIGTYLQCNRLHCRYARYSTKTRSTKKENYRICVLREGGVKEIPGHQIIISLMESCSFLIMALMKSFSLVMNAYRAAEST